MRHNSMFNDGTVQLFNGDCLEVMRKLESNSVESIVTDPPYGLGFMGKAWDIGVPAVDVFAECLRVLKPGGHLLAFGGTRTCHRLTCAVEDAGFEIRDMIAWVYGSGFPKSQNVSKAIDKAAGAERQVVGVDAERHARLKNQIKGSVSTGDQWEHGGRDVNITAPATGEAHQWDGWGTALKPALEPITVARKPLAKGNTVAKNVLEHGTGAINVDGCRVGTDDKLSGGHASSGQQMSGGWERPWMSDPDAVAANIERSKQSVAKSETLGRWPANLIHDGSDEVTGLFPDSKGSGPARQLNCSAKPDQVGWGMNTCGADAVALPDAGRGSAARFFYAAKASKKDRGEGNTHPTVKPTDLMRYLCRLVTPPGGTVLDPFMGSGSTGKAAVFEGFQFSGIEKDEEYFEIAKARVRAAKMYSEKVERHPDLFAGNDVWREEGGAS